MPDAPDGYKYRPAGDRAVLGDLGELAVRLGSIVSYDRKGDVIWLWDGSTGVSTWAISGISGDAYCEVGTSFSNVGGYQLELHADGATDPYVQLIKFFSPVEVSKWGLEVSVALISDYLDFIINIGRDDGVLYYQAGIKLDSDADEILYRDLAGDYIKFADLPTLHNTYGQFHNMKLVIDMDTNKYVSFQMNDVDYDVPKVAFRQTSTSDQLLQKVLITLHGRDGETDYCYLDYVIVTTGEP